MYGVHDSNGNILNALLYEITSCKRKSKISRYIVPGQPHGTSGQALASHRWGPEFASRSLHLGFVVDETGSGQVFRRVSPVFPYHKFHSTISPRSFHPFRSISSAIVMVCQAWSAGTLATHGPIISGLHRISSLDPTLCWTQVEDSLYSTSSSKESCNDQNILSSSECSAQGQVLHCMCRNQGCSSAEGRSSTANSGTKAAVLLGTEQVQQHPVGFCRKFNYFDCKKVKNRKHHHLARNNK